MMIRPMRIFILGLLSIALVSTNGLAADATPLIPSTSPSAVPAAPTAEEWEPIRLAIANRTPTAQTQLLALERRYPVWVDGTNALATYLLEQGKAAEALAAAKRASQLAPANVPARRIQIRSLADLGRKAEIYALVDTTSTTDPAGWIRYEAGLAAVGFHDAGKADTFLTEAKSRIGSKIPSEFLFLESRIALLTRDFARAELALVSATKQQPDFWDGWYELGRVRLVLADFDHAQRGPWISKANAAFTTVCKALPNDAHGHLGLGRAQAEEAKLLLADHHNDQAGGKLREAVEQFNLALTAAPDNAEAYVVLGDAQLRLEQWGAAADALQRAKELGAKDRSLIFNLAIAWQQLGKKTESQALLANFTATTPNEQVTLGMSAYRSGNWLLAVRLLQGVADQLEDATAKGATWRFIGHACSHVAESSSGDEREAALDSAQTAYRTAGDLFDYNARRFYLSLAAARSPEHAYAAAWQCIHWDALNLSAWGVAVGAYGPAKTAGLGLSGMAKHAPVHLALWSALVLIPLVFFGLGLRQRPNGRSSNTAAVASRSRATRTPSSPGSSAPSRTTTRAPAPPPRLPTRPTPRPEINAKDETAEIVYKQSLMKQKAETVAVRTPLPQRAPLPGGKPGAVPLAKPGARRATQLPAAAADQTLIPSTSPDLPGQALERRRP